MFVETREQKVQLVLPRIDTVKKLVLKRFQIRSIDIYQYFDIFDNTNVNFIWLQLLIFLLFVAWMTDFNSIGNNWSHLLKTALTWPKLQGLYQIKLSALLFLILLCGLKKQR